MRRRGSMMLEAVLVLPVFLFLVFFLVQSTFVWTAHQMTLYAAYCAARAALVYNPEDYAGNGGVAKRAACMVLGWISFSHKGNTPVRIPSKNGGYYELPASDGIADQVSVTIEESAAQRDEADAADGKAEAKSAALPVVTATVDFKYPLIVPFGALFLVDVVYPQGGPPALDVKEEDGGWHYVHVRESYTLPKPYRTETFPVVPDEDREALQLK